MIRAIVILFLLLTTPCFGQGFGSFYHDQPYLAKSAASGNNPPYYASLGYWWESEDLTIGSTVYTNQWKDRIQNAPAYAFGTLTNAAAGVYFPGSGTAYTTNVLIDWNVSLASSFVVVMTPITPSTAYGAFLGSSTAGYGFMTRATGALWVWGGPGNGQIGTFSSGTEMTFCSSPWINANVNSIYTNGVLSTTNTFGSNGQQKYFGTDAAGSLFKGYIKSVLVYTNYTLNSNEVAQIQNWIDTR